MIALSLSDINLSFGTDVILKDISFSVNDGDRIGIIGVNGAGKTSLFKVQTAFSTPFDQSKFKAVGIDILSYTQTGSVCSFIVRGDRAAVEEKIRCMNPLLLDMLPLNLEEVFIYEMEALGYAFKEILM